MTAVSRSQPDPIDVAVGRGVRGRRIVLGWSQERLARHLGVSFQQLQKYESGFNRISAATLYRAAQAMDVPISAFFDGTAAGSAPSLDLSLAAMRLARHIDQLPEGMRRTIADIVEQLSHGGRWGA